MLAASRTSFAKLTKIGFARGRALAPPVFALFLQGDSHHFWLLQRAPGEFEEIEASAVQHLHQFDAFGTGEAALLEVRGIEFDPDRKLRPNGFSHGGQDSHQEPGPVLQGSAPFVLTPVGQRAEELRDQIAMRGVQRDAGEVRLADLPRREAELADGALDLSLRHRPRFCEIEAGAAHDIETSGLSLV
jgi:hypothetical protein